MSLCLLTCQPNGVLNHYYRCSANNNGILFKNVQTQTLYDLKFKLFNLYTTTEPEEILFNHNTQMHYDCHLEDCSKSTSKPILTVIIIQN